MCLDAEEQDDELLALASIYVDAFTSAQDQDEEEIRKGGELAIILDLPPDFALVEKQTKENGVVHEEKHFVEHLPPVYVHFTFPPSYPSTSPPSFTLSCKWLNRAQLTQLCHELDRLWEENKGDVIMFTWSQFLKDETLNLLGIIDVLNVETIRPVRQSSICVAQNSPDTNEDSDIVPDDEARAQLCSVDGVDSESDKSSAVTGAISLVVSRQNSQTYDSRTIQDIAPKTNLLKLLRDYDEEMRQKVFATRNFECKVCFMDKSGAHCLEFWPCRHVYCKDCMSSYFEVQISEGNIKFLRCPEDKCESEANPKQVQELVPEVLYQRWEEMLLNSTLSSLGDIQVCPRMHCQYPVTIEDRQGHCPSCKFVFCGLCRFGWHGVEPCRLRKGELKDIMESYLNGDQEVKRGLEERYGRKYINNLKDEYLSMSYLEQNSKSCPKCGAKIEKVNGCNKITCWCGTHVCWLCLRKLKCSEPYSHYNEETSPCFELLFDGMEVQEAPEENDIWNDPVLHFNVLPGNLDLTGKISGISGNWLATFQ
ncbi:E3 ubiquitin-protein ligase RNF14-like isoform X1 [Macrobrachium rosenbergii]|uniref:E3 ubiquitin-protein ligase RNF14-like isoform X1 n=1 Tax=Macrobrachium rosenbergii TaxID=79674 RepID=UPI0034D65664